MEPMGSILCLLLLASPQVWPTPMQHRLPSSHVHHVEQQQCQMTSNIVIQSCSHSLLLHHMHLAAPRSNQAQQVAAAELPGLAQAQSRGLLSIFLPSPCHQLRPFLGYERHANIASLAAARGDERWQIEQCCTCSYSSRACTTTVASRL